MRQHERGQALSELLLLLPAFGLLLLLLSFGAQLLIARLSLIALARDYALLLARNEPSLSASPATQALELRRLCGRTSGLDPKHLSHTLQPMPLPGLKGVDTGPVAGLVQAALLGQRLTLRYELRWGGLLGRCFPDGWTLEEELSFQGDPWKHPWQRVIQRYLLPH